jgi:hypothetical protein
MQNRSAVLSLVATIALVGAISTYSQRSALAQGADMDAKGEAEAKEALRLYKQGLYEDAAKMFAKLSVDYPNMLIFERNVGACFYYLRKAEPAISNLRHYLSRKKDIAPDDKQVVERWIAEMEKLREQEATAILPPPSAPPPASWPAGASAPAPAAQARPGPAPSASPAPLPATVGRPVWAPEDQLLGTSPSPGVPPPVPVAPPPVWVGPAPAPGALPMVPAAAPPAPAPPPPTPAALDLSSSARPGGEQEQSSPFYKTWWFWTGTAVVVVGGALTAYLLATRGGTENACSGETIPCDGVK